MKHSIVLKAIALVLAACSLVVAAGSGLGIIFFSEMGIYTDTIEPHNRIPWLYTDQAEHWSIGVIVLLVGALVVFGALMVYLCCVAGHSRTSPELRPGGLNRLPLDLYAAGVLALGFVCVRILDWYLLPMWFDFQYYLNTGMVALSLLVAFAGVLAALGWFFALAAQVKMPKAYVLRHTVAGSLLVGCWRAIKWCFRGIGRLCRRLHRLYRLLPMVWQRIAVVIGWLFGAFLFVVCVETGAEIFGILVLFVLLFGGIALFVYDLYGFGTVMKGAKDMAGGNLHTQIHTRHLFGAYRDHANHLNAMADVASVAAREQMKSDRMKTELITNVSHDIKTPLTSIINYVDLLQKPHTQEEQAQYLEVLERQSLRMKKLLEDLMEMSKASTGNIAVSIGRVDAVETVNQALGEFADKLAAAQLTPRVQAPESPVHIQADGRLTWRVLSNLLSNVVKYAQPGTRVYLDLERIDSTVKLSVKNISRDALNVSADELTERFVRGDASRNTEGSGLGLNIAKTLMELQKGKLELTVDGDLFRVDLTFPAG